MNKKHFIGGTIFLRQNIYKRNTELRESFNVVRRVSRIQRSCRESPVKDKQKDDCL